MSVVLPSCKSTRGLVIVMILLVTQASDPGFDTENGLSASMVIEKPDLDVKA